MRRAVVIQEAVVFKILRARKISDASNLADVFTKYLKFDKWRRVSWTRSSIWTPRPSRSPPSTSMKCN